MMYCPTCHRTVADETLKFCRDDGSLLVAATGETKTALLSESTRDRTPSTGEIRSGPSIAVLSFVNTSAEAENEYFCDGLAEEILNALAKIEALRVVARTSAFFFKGKDIDVREIGRKLNVATVLEGSVRKSGKHVRVTAQLISVADGYHLWSERYVRELKDIFDVQDEITLAVVGALKVKLLGEEKAAVLKRYTENTEAYELYLRGRHYVNKDTAQGWLNAISFFDQAIKKEPDYAPAYAATAECYSAMHVFGVRPHGEIISKWQTAVNRALEVDDRFAEAHLARANNLFWYEWNWVEAEREFKRAIELHPNSTFAYQMYGLFLASQERFDEAISAGRRALKADTLSLLAKLRVGWIYLFSDREQDALEQVRKMIEIDSTFHGAYWLKGAIHLSRGRYEEAIDALLKSLAAGGNPITLSSLGCAYGLAGKQEEALRVLRESLEMREQKYAAASNISRVYAGLSDHDQAFAWLEKAVKERTGELVFLKLLSTIGNGESWGKDFLADPRSQEMFRRIGLPGA